MRNHKWLGLFAILAATIMNLLDSTVVTVAAPAIRADLGGSYASLQWIAASYTLALAVGLLTGGRLGDMFGRRRMLMIGVVGFVVASLACAAAWSPEALIGARVLQGLFGAVMIPQGFGLIRDLFPPHEIGKAFGAFGPIIGLSTILGPIVAGLLVDADLFGTGWRAVFAVNLPIGLFALLAGAKALPLGVSPAARTLRLDVGGAVLAGAGMLMLVYPLVQGRELGWPAWLFALLAASVAVLGVFVMSQVRRKRSGRTPLVELSVFSKRSYSTGVLFVIVFFGAVVGLSLAIGLFLQLGLGYSPVKASLTMATWAVGAFVGTGFAAGTMAKLGRHVLHLGLALIAAGLTWVYAVFAQAGVGVDGGDLALPLLVYGVGMGMIFVPLFDIIMAGVADHEVGSASGMLESLQQLGASLGVAVLGTVFFGTIGTRFDPATSVAASKTVTLITLGLIGLAFVLGFFLPRRARAHAPAAPVPADAPDLVAA
ncbi:EmrB/QacA subfamily drug resistance transporter [Hamadaea flava]|uniref:MFS transporter n=1 Tax=Hamadaea flava TaxID=1742688 RepID=A0ABV8M1B1_9ACTN|nr:MFS transporter [Hamadaea flava]MCP2325759.1 EmrB/QacA subfamily drug resistance transporter [Hamadaea flava]